MTPKAALTEWLGRVGALAGVPLMMSADDLTVWPVGLVVALKNHGMMLKAMPAQSVVCPGCERACMMPVEVPVDGHGAAWPFVMCDKRSDTSRVPVGVATLERWKSSVESVSHGVASLLDAPCASVVDATGKVWAVGSVKGKALRGRVSLTVDAGLVLEVSGRRVPLVDVLTVDGDDLALDVGALEQMADRPMVPESEKPAQRHQRIAARVAAVRATGERAFLQAVAMEEGLDVSRIKQILALAGRQGKKLKEVTLQNAWGYSTVSKNSKTSRIPVKS